MGAADAIKGFAQARESAFFKVEQVSFSEALQRYEDRPAAYFMVGTLEYVA